MYKIAGLFFVFFIISCPLWSRTLPKEGADLNYRLIGFSFPFKEKANKYKLEIADGNYYSEDSFRKNIIRTISCEEDKIITEVPFFGKQYTWQVVYTTKNSKTIKSVLHHFSTMKNPVLDTALRLRVLHPAQVYQDAFVFLDNYKAMYDMKGNLLWFFPDKADNGVWFRDMKLSSFGTITFIYKQQIYEVNYSGDTLWKGPNNGKTSGDSIANYHHEFTRLSSGHYMVLGEERMLWKPRLKDTGHYYQGNVNHNHSQPYKSPFGTILEYDKRGNLVWTWKTSAYFLSSDLYYNPPESFAKERIDMHDNSFYFDEKDSIIYLSFKNIDRIIKLKYPEGTVLNTYGEIYKAGIPVKGNGLFCGQHSIRRSEDGNLYLFNNNSCDSGKPPTVIVMKEPADGGTELKKVWEYECLADTNKALVFHQGGNVIEFPDSSLFVSMGPPYAKIFIVNKDKEILWSALPERWNPRDKKWNVNSLYRASIVVDKKVLEKLVWNVGK